MIDGVGLPPPAPSALAGAATATPSAGSFLNLLAGGFAFPAPVAEMLEAPGDERVSDPELLEADATGFLSTWFGLTPLPPAANDAGFTRAYGGATARPLVSAALGSSPTPLPGVVAPPGSVETSPLAEGGRAEAATLALALDAAALSDGAVAPALGVDLSVEDFAVEGFGTLVQDPAASLGGRAVERLAPAPPSVGQSLNVDADFEVAAPLGSVETSPLAEGGRSEAMTFAVALETAALNDGAVAYALGVDLSVEDFAMEGFGTLVQDPAASLGGRAVERLAPAPASVSQPLNVDADFEVLAPPGSVETSPLAEGGRTEAATLALALETAALNDGAVAAALGVDLSVEDFAVEGFGTLVQDPAASLGGRAVERLAPGPPSVAQPLHVDADFEAAFDAQLRWQVETGVSEAVIDLNPAELGALTIRIQMHGDQTSLQIHAAEAATRQLLQQLLPQMGERLAQSGLLYSGGEVRDRMREEGEADTASGAASRTTTGRRTIRIHLVDAYV